MKKEKGSITVFLSLILVLLFSFLLTALEAARITGATAYISMISKLSGESLLAHYYFPLFEEYKLFGVDAGYETSYFSKEKIKQQLSNDITFGLEGIEGGLFSFEKPVVSINEYKTMLSEEGEGFLKQVKEQSILDGMVLGAVELFDIETLSDVGNVGEVYQKQEEALRKTDMITQEILRLMELVDGICMSEQGLSIDTEGRLQLHDAFIKQLVCMSQEELSKAYENEEVFETVQQGIFSPKQLAENIKQLMIEAMDLEQQIFSYDEEIKICKENLSIVQEQLFFNLDIEEIKELLLKEEELKEEKKRLSQERDFLVEEFDLILMDASEQYDSLKRKLDNIEPLILEALHILDVLEQKQIIARIAVEDYETFLVSKKEELSEELYEVFEQELNNMKLYVGMEEQGYYVPLMRQSLQKNQSLLQELSLSGFSYSNLEQIKLEMQEIEMRIDEYTVEGLWFIYGEIYVTQETGYSIVETLEELLTEGIFTFVGIEMEDISEKELMGQELPSQLNVEENITEDLLECMDSIVKCIQEGNLKELLEGVTETALNTIALEVYFNQYFGCYMEEKNDSKLLYEREYLLFGKSKEQENLVCMILYLIAFRTLFTMLEIIKTPQKMVQLQNMAMSVAGITGIPLLISMTKYMMLLLWSVEEAVIEISAILQGKKLPVVKGSGGMLSYQEIFSFHPKLVAQKVKLIPTIEKGAGYQEYLMLFSLTRSIKSKVYYAMDLIQENIRYKYRDSFRMRNVLIQVDFSIMTKLKKKYDTNLFSEQAYELNWRQRYSY